MEMQIDEALVRERLLALLSTILVIEASLRSQRLVGVI
jgi:hypothetical protein